MHDVPGKLKIRRDVTIAILSLEHAQNMFRWVCDPVVSHNLGLRSQPSLERTQAWITHALEDPSIHPVAILLKGCHVGNVILDRIDGYLSTARLSVYIGEPSARQSGVGSTGIYLTLVEGFERLGLNKVWLTVHARNPIAINAYARLGFVLEGILRDEFWFEEQRVNLLYMGLLYSEFKVLSTEQC